VQEELEALRTSPDIDGVLLAHLDRLARQADLERIEDLFKESA